MRRFILAIFFCCGLIFSQPGRAQADLITITGGALDISGLIQHSGPLTLSSDRLTASLTATTLGAYSPCFGCAAGQVIDIGGQWLSPDVVGSVTLDGTSYSGFTSSSSNALLVQFLGTATFPALWTPQPVVLVQPFTFHGLFSFEPGPGQFSQVNLAGGGVSTLTFLPDVERSRWVFSRGVYEFTPVPEPSTLTLIGLGAIGLLRRRFR
jgi:hypothetical protein